MDEATLNRAIEILETDPDFYVPIKRLWSMLREEGLALDLELEDFHTQLAADERFEFREMEPAEDSEDLYALDTEMEQEMEMLGFFSGFYVKLVSRTMTAEDVFAGLTRSLAQLTDALHGAWEARPRGDPEAEGMLRDAMALAEQLEQEILEMIEGQGEQPIEGDEEQSG